MSAWWASPTHRAGLSSGALALAATGWLYTLVIPFGLETGYKDQRHYIAPALSLAEGRGLTFENYYVESEILERAPLTSFPPLLSLVYAGLHSIGVQQEIVPVVTALICWVLLLAGIAVLTTRLAGDPWLGVLAMATSSVTTPFLNVFTSVSSEVLFLPLLVWSAVSFTNLPEDGAARRRRILLGAALLATLPLVRYVGVVLAGAVGLWWLADQLRHRRPLRSALPEAGLLVAVPIPLGLWLGRNWVLEGALFGPTLASGPLESSSLLSVALSFPKHLCWIALPVVRPGPIWRATGGGFSLALLTVLALFSGYLLRRAWREGRARQMLGQCTFFALSAYLVFLALAPILLRVRGLTERYSTVALVLVFPILFALAGSLPRRLRLLAPLAFLALNVALLFFIGIRADAGGWLRGLPPRPVDLANRPALSLRLLRAGVPPWLVSRPPRTGDLVRHHPELVALLASQDPPWALVTNAPQLFDHHPLAIPAERALGTWLDVGSCQSTETRLLLLVMNWDRWEFGLWRENEPLPDPAALVDRIAAKCPSLARTTLPHATAFILPPSGEQRP